MVRNYKRRTEDKWSKESLLEALTSVTDGKKKISDCAVQYKIPRATLYRHVKKMNLEGIKYLDVRQINKCGGHPILSRLEEDVLETTVKDLMTQGYSVTPVLIKRICYEYCECNGIPNRFSEEKRLASDDWYYGFINRHPDLKSSKQKEKASSSSSGVSQHDMKMKEEPHSKSQDPPITSGKKVSTDVGTSLKKPLKRLNGDQNRGRTKGAVSSSKVQGQVQEVVAEEQRAEDNCANNLEEECTEKVDVEEGERESIKDGTGEDASINEYFSNIKEDHEFENVLDEMETQVVEVEVKSERCVSDSEVSSQLTGDSAMEESAAAVLEEDVGAEEDEESTEWEESTDDDDDDDDTSVLEEDESAEGDFEECEGGDKGNDIAEGGGSSDDDDEGGGEEEIEGMERDDENGVEVCNKEA